MAIKVGDAVIKLGLDKKDFDRDMKGLRGAIQKHRKAIGIAMIGVGVAAIGAAAASVKAFADMGDEVQKMSLRTGISTEVLSEFRHAAELSGASLTTLEKGVKKMSKTIVDADEGMATYIRSFDRIGLSAEELMELSPEDQFIRITEAIAKLESPTLRAATAQDIFGRAGTELLPLMAAGSEGLADMRQEAHKLGIVFDQEAANAAAEFNDSLTRLNGALTGVKFTLARELMPSLEAGIPILEHWVTALGPIIENTLNWNAAQDKQTKQQNAWRDMMQQRMRMIGGLSHELEVALNLAESTLRTQGLLTEQNKETIRRIREEIKVRKDHEEVIEDTNEDLEEQLKLQQEQLEMFEETTEMVEDIIKEFEFEQTVAGKLGLTIRDVVTAMHLMGMSTEAISNSLNTLGEEQDDVNAVLRLFGKTAEQVAEKLGIEIDAVKDLIDSYEDLTDAVEDSEEARGEGTRLGFGSGIISPGMSPEQIAYAKGWKWGELTPERYARVVKLAGNPPGYKEGGIAMSPTLAMVGENAPRIPEALIPLDKLEAMMSGVTITGNIFNVRKQSDIDDIGEALVRKMRAKGIKI